MFLPVVGSSKNNTSQHQLGVVMGLGLVPEGFARSWTPIDTRL